MSDAGDISQIQTGTLDTIQKIVTVGADLPYYWFRGHSSSFGNLTPGIFREDDGMSFYPEREINSVSQFRRQSPGYGTRLPQDGDFLGWLMFMQHYSLPTRLLDWIESVLVASYFAVSERRYAKDDGEVWVMFPLALNTYSVGVGRFPSLDNPDLRYLAMEPFANNPTAAMNEVGRIEFTPKAPLAFEPRFTIPRMVAQRSVFTIHPTHVRHRLIQLPISEAPVAREHEPTIDITLALSKNNQHLCKYIIPSAAKPKLLSDLESLGFNENTLFVDWDSLSAAIKREITPGGTACIERTPPFLDLKPKDSENSHPIPSQRSDEL